MEIGPYLRRIAYKGTTESTFETLRSLHIAHMYSVPFENLDIHLKTQIVLDLRRLYKKIVNNKRGGFCYELNGLFGFLLSELGFEVDMLSARVYGRDGELGPDFDHMLLRVNKEFIADVGFGDSFVEPLHFNEDEHVQSTGTYTLTEVDNSWLLERERDGERKPQYLFKTRPRELNEFTEMCDYQQTSLESIFTQKSVCSKATPEGRITISNGRLIETKNGKVAERAITGEDEYRKLLRTLFGISLGGETEALVEIEN